MTTKASNSVLNLVNPPIDNIVMRSATLIPSGAHSVLIGNGVSPITSVPPGDPGLVLVTHGVGLDPSFGTVGLNALPVIDVPHGGTGTSYLAPNNVIIGAGYSPVHGAAPTGRNGAPLVSNVAGADPYFSTYLDVDNIRVVGGATITYLSVPAPGGGADINSCIIHNLDVPAPTGGVAGGTGHIYNASADFLTVGTASIGTASMSYVGIGTGRDPALGPGLSVNSANITNASIATAGITTLGVTNENVTNLAATNLSASGQVVFSAINTPLLGANGTILRGVTLGTGLSFDYTNNILYGSPSPGIVSDFWIAPSGNNGNSGTDPGSPWRDFNHAINTILNRIGLGTARINVYPGTYSADAVTAQFTAGNWIIQGLSDVHNQIIYSSSVAAMGVAVSASVKLSNITILAPPTNGILVGGTLELLGWVNFGGCAGAHLNVGYNGTLIVSHDVLISGPAAAHLLCINGTAIYSDQVNNIGFYFEGGTQGFTSAFISANDNSTVIIPQAHVAVFGSASGRKFIVDTNSILDTRNGDVNYLPGDQPGIQQRGGIYA